MPAFPPSKAYQLLALSRHDHSRGLEPGSGVVFRPSGEICSSIGSCVCRDELLGDLLHTSTRIVTHAGHRWLHLEISFYKSVDKCQALGLLVYRMLIRSEPGEWHESESEVSDTEPSHRRATTMSPGRGVCCSILDLFTSLAK